MAGKSQSGRKKSFLVVKKDLIRTGGVELEIANCSTNLFEAIQKDKRGREDGRGMQ